MSYLSVDNLIGVIPTTTSSVSLECQSLDVYNGTINYHRITSSAGSPLMTITIPNASGTLTLNTATQTITNKMNHAQVGSAADPSYSFAGDVNTGFFRSAANTIGVSTAGVQRITISASNMTSTLPVQCDTFRTAGGVGGAGNVVYGYTNTTGMWFGLNRVNFSTNSTERLNIQDTGISSSVPIRVLDGTVATPSISFNLATASGFSHTGSGRISVSAAGSSVFQFANGGFNQSSLSLLCVNGTAANPAIVSSGYNNTGFYWSAGPVLNVSVSGTQRAAFTSNGVLLYGSTAGNNALYVPSGLQYYEEAADINDTFTFGNQNATNIPIRLTRIGRMIFMQTRLSMNFATPSTAQDTVQSTNNIIPARFRPQTVNAETCGCVDCFEAGTSRNLWNVIVNFNGRITIQRNAGTLTNTLIVNTFSCSWHVDA